jgi:hypothetical protein
VAHLVELEASHVYVPLSAVEDYVAELDESSRHAS